MASVSLQVATWCLHFGLGVPALATTFLDCVNKSFYISLQLLFVSVGLLVTVELLHTRIFQVHEKWCS